MADFSKAIVDIKTQIDEKDEYEIEVIPVFDDAIEEDNSNAYAIDQRLNDLEIELNKRNERIEKLESHADGIDYAVAAACGLLTGILDAFFVGEFSLEGANKWGTEKCNKFVENFANKTARKDPELKDLGKDFKFDNLAEAVRYLEKKYKVNYDIAGKTLGQGDHHLNDFAHHPSLFGLIISIVSQLGGSTLGCDANGVLQWVDCSASNAMVQGNNIFEKLFYAISNWGCHLVSDMIGSSSAVLKGNAGTGIPGPILSMLQESVGIFKKKDPNAQAEIQMWLNDAFRGRLKGQNGVPFDLRTELGTFAHLGKQALVVGINEVVVRAFYLIRRFIMEIKKAKIKSFKDIKKINWKSVLLFKNRTIVRMLTISMSTMTAVDTADAAIRAAAKSGGNGYAFLAQFALRINYVGVGRTIIACALDGVMGAQLNYNRNKRIEIYNEYISLNSAKMFYKQGDLWLLAQDVDKSIEHSTEMVRQSQELMKNHLLETKKDSKEIRNAVLKGDEKNEGLKDDIKDILKWGL